MKPVFRIRTALGRTIRATANHKFLAPEGWKRLDELRPGGRMAVPGPVAGAEDGRVADWDRIVSIEPEGDEEVFDLTVPGPHNFVANDIIAHNSIEQDADVVAFIYRAERYGITVDENGNSTEGIAEIIVGKQRNGPTGDVRLAFVHQYARFENLTTYTGSSSRPAAAGDFGRAGDGYGEPGDDAPF